MAKAAVHFGASNIWRGFVARHASGYEVCRAGAPATELAERITGLEAEHPLLPHVVEVGELRLSR